MRVDTMDTMDTATGAGAVTGGAVVAWAAEAAPAKGTSVSEASAERVARRTGRVGMRCLPAADGIRWESRVAL
ncbi:hypothetical protein GCM10018952_29830 [Streptosporangium vulgare]